MNKEIKEHIDNLINNFNNMSYTEQQEELFELYKTGEVEYVDVVDKFSNSVKKYKHQQNNWNELKEWLKEEHFNYKNGWFTQDMATTYRVDGHINALEIVSNKMQEIESRK